MEVNNAMYETLGHLWWSEEADFEITSLRYSVNPVRYGYFKRQLEHLHAPGKSVLDIGCGGGFLAEEFAKDRYDVTGIDPSGKSIAAAREHAAKSSLAIDYRVGRGESLPFRDDSFDIVACCDVLEHVDDPAQVLREVSRVLKPGGIFFYDTVNRTFRSWIALIKVWQDWNMIGSAQPNAHVWEKFIKPKELAAMMRVAGLAPGPVRGMTPAKGPLAMFRTFRQIRTGQLRAAAVGREFALRDTDDLSVSYMGWAVKGEAVREVPRTGKQ